MGAILYLYIFLIGITFGSFFTLAVYRIPLGKDITHTRSFCPNCNHKLGFWDMIPLFSYIFLGGKCRYCKQKIRPRYFILELLSGMVFVLFAMSIKIHTLEISKMVYFIFGLLYIAGLFIICGIDKERIQIQNEVILYMSIVEALYMIYLYVIEKTSIYRYVIYLFVLALLIALNIIYFRKKIKNNYYKIVFAIYDKNKEKVLDIDNCALMFKAKDIDTDLKNAFGNKDMIVLN